jgi:hypothetical protein
MVSLLNKREENKRTLKIRKLFVSIFSLNIPMFQLHPTFHGIKSRGHMPKIFPIPQHLVIYHILSILLTHTKQNYELNPMQRTQHSHSFSCTILPQPPFCPLHPSNCTPYSHTPLSYLVTLHTPFPCFPYLVHFYSSLPFLFP